MRRAVGWAVLFVLCFLFWGWSDYWNMGEQTKTFIRLAFASISFFIISYIVAGTKK